MFKRCLMLIWLVLPAIAAADLRTVHVENEGKVYISSRGRVRRRHRGDSMRCSARLRPDSGVLRAGSSRLANVERDGERGFYIVNRGCVLFFCKTLKR